MKRGYELKKSLVIGATNENEFRNGAKHHANFNNVTQVKSERFFAAGLIRKKPEPVLAVISVLCEKILKIIAYSRAVGKTGEGFRAFLVDRASAYCGLVGYGGVKN